MRRLFTDMLKRHCRIISIITLSIVFALISAMIITVTADNTECFIECTVSGSENDRISVRANISKEAVEKYNDDTIFFFELAPCDDIRSLSSLTPLFETRASTSVSKNVDLASSSTYSSFVAALQNEDGTYTAISNRAYINNPEKLAENDSPYPTKATKKGICAQITSDAQYLGAEHTIISIDIAEYLAPGQSDSTIALTRYGQTFYFYSDMLSALDHKVKVLTEAGMNVYFNIVLGKDGENGLDFMYLDGVSDSSSLYAVNTSTASAARYFSVFCEFIAERYSSYDSDLISAYILGYEVNSESIWNDAGSIDFDSYVNGYVNAYRILYNAVKSTSKNARVFVSISNLFNSDSDLRTYGARDFLDSFATKIRDGGDIPWALALNPYASDPALTEFWLDENANDDIDTPYITMKNLSVLTEYMHGESMLFEDEVRDMIISEFGVNGNYSDAKNSDCQAAAYALAYAIADMNEDIDAFIYYRHVDHPAESAHFGLWTSNAASPLTPDNKKSIYNIFRNVDTDAFGVGLDMAKNFLGDELYEKYLGEYTSIPKKKIIESIPVIKSDIRTTFKEKTLFDLTSGDLCGFYPSDNSAYVELRPTDDDLATALYSRQRPASGQTFSGISRDLSQVDLSHAEYITLSFTPCTPSTQTVTVMLRLDCDDDSMSYTYEGIVQLTSNSENELSFKISDFIRLTDGNVDSMKIWYKPSSGTLEDGEYGLWLNNVSIHEKTGLSAFVTVFVWVISILLFAFSVVVIIYVRNNKPIRNKIKGMVGKTKSKIIGFLKDKKIISRRHKKKKGARFTPPKAEVYVKKEAPAHTNNVRIVNGRVMPRKPAQTKGNTSSKNTQSNTTSNIERNTADNTHEHTH